MDKNIKLLKSELDKPKNEKDEFWEDDLRTKKNLFAAMINKYQSIIQKFQNEEEKIKEIKQTKIIREAEIGLGCELTKEEKEMVLDNPKMVQKIYQEKLQGKAHPTIINFVKDLEDRHHDIKKLEKSILELNQMISTLQSLVQYRGEIIDNITDNINSARVNVENAGRILEDAKEKMERKKKIKCVVSLILIIVLLIIIIPIISKFTKK